jgi:hypothetical protein
MFHNDMFDNKDSRRQNIYMKKKKKDSRKAYMSWYNETERDPNQFLRTFSKELISNKMLVSFNYLYSKGCSCNGCSGLLYSSSKFKKLAANQGKNKGKQSYYMTRSANLPKWNASKDCSEYDFSMVIKYKDNSPTKPDESLPVCQICYDNNSGKGKYIFKKCDHGKVMCSLCARRVFTCPFCRAER